MAKQVKATEKPAESAPTAAPAEDDKAIQKKKREFRTMKARLTALRQIAKTASDERKVLDGKLTVLAEELGMPFKSTRKPAEPT